MMDRLEIAEKGNSTTSKRGENLEQQKDPKLLPQQVKSKSRLRCWTKKEEDEKKIDGEHQGEVQKVQGMEGL